MAAEDPPWVRRVKHIAKPGDKIVTSSEPSKQAEEKPRKEAVVKAEEEKPVEESAKKSTKKKKTW